MGILDLIDAEGELTEYGDRVLRARMLRALHQGCYRVTFPRINDNGQREEVKGRVLTGYMAECVASEKRMPTVGGATPPAVVTLAEEVAEIYLKGLKCPACGGSRGHQDNGMRVESPEYTLLCPCGEQWTPNE